MNRGIGFSLRHRASCPYSSDNSEDNEGREREYDNDQHEIEGPPEGATRAHRIISSPRSECRIALSQTPSPSQWRGGKG